MKKFALMLALALPLSLASCGDDNEGSISLDQTNVSLDYGKTLELKASEKSGVWASSNDFVATVDQKGKVEAKHEGTAKITVSKNGASASCVVTVVATNNTFNTITTWGATVAEVKANIPADLVLLVDKTDQLLYTLAGNAYPWYGFQFKNNALAGSSLYFTDEMFDNYDFNGYLAQRFVKISTDGQVVYANAQSLTNASEAVVVDYDTEDEVWIATWMPVSHTKASAIDFTIVKKAKELYKSVK